MPDIGLGIFTPSSNRSIGGIVADVTVEENERDDVTVTEHPVEQGAPIGDHAFKRPEEVTLKVGWSASRSGDLSADSGWYGILLNWQASFTPFDLTTGKRRHRNMLITSITVVTDETTEWALMAMVTCREVILTTTSTTTTGLSGSTSNMAQPESTAPQVDLGSQETPSIPNTNAIDGIVPNNIPNTSAIDNQQTLTPTGPGP